MITREFNLYLHAGHSIPLVINCNQYDQGEQWLFTLFNADGTQYVPSSGAIVGIKSDNLGIINSGTVDSQGRVVINETQQMTASVGKAVFELVIDDGTHGTANFVVLVEPKPGNNADLSETDISMIEQAIEAASSIKPYGSPLVASTVADMTDHEKVYVYVGSETGYTSGNWYYWDGTAWTSGGVYNSVAVQTDTTLTLSGAAADAKKTGDEISDLKSQLNTIDVIPREVRIAMDTLFSKMGVKDDDGYSSQYGLFHAWASAINLVSISATFTQGNNIVCLNTPLNDLKQFLVVTATYEDNTTAPVSAYTLSGTLTAGTSTVTVTYDNKTTTFTVNVTNANDVTPDLSTVDDSGSSKVHATYNSADGSIRVYTSQAQAYAAAGIPFVVDKTYTYRIDYDAVYASGAGRIVFADSVGTIRTGWGSGCTFNSDDTAVADTGFVQSGSYYYTPDLTKNEYDVAQIRLYCTWTSNINGDITYKNIKVLQIVGE